MKIVHICLAGLYMSGWGYQDNLIAKYHKKEGHEVFVIANKYVYDNEGNYERTDKSEEEDINGVKIIRLSQKGNKMLKGPAERVHYIGLYDAIAKIGPDVIFLHNPQILDTGDIARYMKESISSGVKLFIDSHSDYSNSARNFLSKHILHGIIWRGKVKKLIPYTEKFFGVLPARVDFLIERYHTPKDKTELLVMGMDDEIAEETTGSDEIQSLKSRLNISDDDFVIISGGKIDHAKRQTMLLIQAVRQIDNPHIRLILFGSVVDDMKAEFEKECDADERISYIGWLQASETYKYFAASKLAVFPGRHSVMWEQVAGQGIPMICKYWEGTTHVDVGGNVKFLYNDSVEEIKDMLVNITEHPEEYQKMYDAAKKGKDTFSYRRIAKQAINE